jgi:hypothetical protein
MNKENSYSLHSTDNFNKIIDVDINKYIINKYIELIIEYLNFITENFKIKNPNYSKFIIIRGLETITNVFNMLFFYTKNIDLTYFHCQKSFYYYVEFIGQITEEQNVFLQLSSRDATTYVYKKTIFEINNVYRKNILTDKQTSEKLDLINKHLQIYNIILLKILNDDDFISNYDKEYIKQIGKVLNKLNSLNFDIDNLYILELFINILDNKILNIEKFMEIILLYLKKIQKNTNITTNITSSNIIKITKEKLYLDEIDSYLEETPEKFINWIIE